MRKKLLQELTGLIYDLNVIDKEHVWSMDYSGHVDSISVFYGTKEDSDCKHCGAPPQKKNTYIAMVTELDEIDPIVEEVRAIKNRLQGNENE